MVASFDAIRLPDGGARDLPQTVTPNGYYYVAPSVASNEVHWNLAGVPGNDTSSPVHATFQPILLTNPDGTSLDVSSLPVPPVVSTVESMGFGGPAGTPTTLYIASDLQPGTYIRTVTPDPPFDQAFGPAIETVQISSTHDDERVTRYDTTGTVNPVLPGATITRDRGSFDGWNAYLRDPTNTVISNVAPLHGQTTSVTFTVLRIAPPSLDGGTQQDQDALDGAALVVTPPSGSIEPAYLGNIINEVLAAPQYPTLPAPVVVEGTILGPYGEPVAADLVFEARGITDVFNGQPQLDTQSFELTRWVSVDASAAGQYSVVLPPGEYRFDIRPRDTAHALLVRDLEVPVEDVPLRVDVSLGTPTSATGSVVVADGRPIAGAVIQAIPTQCTEPAALQQFKPSPWCLPRPAQTTATDGNFRLELDPGQYSLLAQPPDGSRLPWVPGAAPLQVATTTASDAGVLRAPAPIALFLELRDPGGSPIPNALVRAFRTSPQQAPVELGNAVTDATGRFEMYVAPPNSRAFP
jgi:hypothetical protein